MLENPFTPNFGQVPVVLAGRDFIQHEVLQALDAGYGDPALTSLLVGPRGSGKTALLSLIAQDAQQRGWICANVSCMPGFMDKLLYGATLAAGEHVDVARHARLTSVSVGEGFGLEWEHPSPEPVPWEYRMASLLEKLQEVGIGLLLTIDEVDAGEPEMVQFVSDYQLLVRRGFKIALLMAGLPSQTTSLMNKKQITFLRRASQYHLETLSDSDVDYVIGKTVASGGKSIESAALSMAVEASDGFPYMTQLVGFRTWQAAGHADVITCAHAEVGVRRACEDFETRVLRATISDLSDRDLEFVEAMLEDDGATEVSSLEARLGMSANSVSQYRRRLIDQGVIAPAGRGKVVFCMPRLRAYLLENR